MSEPLRKDTSNVLIKPVDSAFKEASSALALLQGKADSICRLFKREIYVTKDDLSCLNEMMLDKLSLHSVTSVLSSVDMSFQNKKILSFKSWPEFENYNFNTINSPTKSIYISWDFFIKLEQYQNPQRHTVSVRISSFPNPSDFFKVLLSGGFDEAHDLDIQESTMICKVDFINHTLAEELVNVVDDWNAQRECAISKRGPFKMLIARHRDSLSRILQYSILFSSGMATAIALKLMLKYRLFFPNVENLLYCFIGLLFIFKVCKDASAFFGSIFNRKLSNLMETHVFSISLGDTKELQRIEAQANVCKEVVVFALNIIVSIVISYYFYIL